MEKAVKPKLLDQVRGKLRVKHYSNARKRPVIGSSGLFFFTARSTRQMKMEEVNDSWLTLRRNEICRRRRRIKP